LLVIASVIGAALLINAVYPSIVRSSNAISRISQQVDQRIESQISIPYGAAELDKFGVWVDSDGDTRFDVWVWVKNVGSARILGIDQTDVFFGTEGNFRRIPYVDDAAGTFPSWSYVIENGTEWGSTVTVKLTIHYAAALTTGIYIVKVVVPSGAYGELFFSF
jgi:archaellum component FlaG (FlaF/FlaG flagellin family)